MFSLPTQTLHRSPEPTAEPRSRNADMSRAAILKAAQRLFSTDGYVGTGIRDVARLAGVNSALVGRYFGTKLQLFEAALCDMLHVSPLLATDRADFGRHAMALLASTHGAGPLAMMLLASADPQARDMSVGLLNDRVIVPLAQWLGEPGGEGKAARIALLWNGFLHSTRLLPMPTFAGDGATPLLAWMAEVTQHIVDEEENAA